MTYQVSKSEKKRQAKNIENLAFQLVELSKQDIAKLPVDDFLKEDITAAQGLKGGSKKRQIKYISKQLRREDTEPLFTFLAEQKGSKLKEDLIFHQLEKLRDDIITQALDVFEEALDNGMTPPRHLSGGARDAAMENYPDLDFHELDRAALRYAATRKPAHSREVFRLLKAAHERSVLSQLTKKN